MQRKPSPAELARFVNEDQYGLPMISVPPGVSPDVYNAGSEFDQGGGQQQDDMVTTMQQCAATSCQHNEAGRCMLESIDINDRGGCAQYEASASGDGSDGRYEETESDVTGGTMPQVGQIEQKRHWRTGKWDPRGGG